MSENKSFELAVRGNGGSELIVPQEMLDSIDASDKAGVTDVSVSSFPPIVRISKGTKNDKPVGLFHMYNKPLADAGQDIPDIPGPLLVTVIWEQHKQDLWSDEGKKACWSNDAIMGEGDPGGACIRCPKNQWFDNVKPECAPINHLACWDYALSSVYILEIKRRQLSIYDDYKNGLGADGSTRFPHMVVTEITLKENKKGSVVWYTPAFRTIDIVEIELFKKFREMRTTLANVLNAARGSADLGDNDDMAECPI